MTLSHYWTAPHSNLSSRQNQTHFMQIKICMASVDLRVRGVT